MDFLPAEGDVAYAIAQDARRRISDLELSVQRLQQRILLLEKYIVQQENETDE